jgi:hypothetical protein
MIFHIFPYFFLDVPIFFTGFSKVSPYVPHILLYPQARGDQVPFVCGCRNLGEALRRIAEGASMIRTKGEAGAGEGAIGLLRGG